MVKNLDDNVGRLLTHLTTRGLDENTIVIFASDNGGFVGTDRGQSVPVTSNAPLRSGKGSLYEGGIRVPLMVRWPGVTTANRTCSTPVTLMDVSHTLLTLTQAGSSEPADGVSLRPLLQDPSQTLARDALYFHYPHYYPTTTPVGAIRSGDWKLLEYFEDETIELYNLETDPGESQDLSASRPDIAAGLRDRLRQWRMDVDAEMPTVNQGFAGRQDGSK